MNEVQVFFPFVRSYVFLKVYTLGWKSGLVITSTESGGRGGAIRRNGVRSSFELQGRLWSRASANFFMVHWRAISAARPSVSCTLHSKSIIVWACSSCWIKLGGLGWHLLVNYLNTTRHAHMRNPDGQGKRQQETNWERGQRRNMRDPGLTWSSDSNKGPREWRFYRRLINDLAPVIERVNNFTSRIGHFPADKMWLVGVHFIHWVEI